MSGPSDFIELAGLEAKVDRVEYRPDIKAPADRPHCFVYFITIHNGSDRKVTIRARKWLVTNNMGDTLVLEGDGVVGQTPELEPGSFFQYNSCHLLDTLAGAAEGAYFGVDESKQRVMTRIPKFEMRVPRQKRSRS